mmetsp:Transcript_28033/g.58940  ORF Transcript_28033/g.58940 Transcript_28033/m.58940 type:complete len:133 (-) Transcript_28033:225-623(-)
MVSTSIICITAILSIFGCSFIIFVNACESYHSYPLASSLGRTEGAFIRGMMAADHQFELYMSASHGARDREDQTLSSRAQELRRRGGRGEDLSLNTVDRVRDVAVDFANTVRRRSFFKAESLRRTECDALSP